MVDRAHQTSRSKLYANLNIKLRKNSKTNLKNVFETYEQRRIQ